MASTEACPSIGIRRSNTPPASATAGATAEIGVVCSISASAVVAVTSTEDLTTFSIIGDTGVSTALVLIAAPRFVD